MFVSTQEPAYKPRAGYALIRTIPAGSRFRLPSTGKLGTLFALGPGSAIVDLDEDVERTFVPTYGPNAGKTVTIRSSVDRTTISLNTEVVYPIA